MKVLHLLPTLDVHGGTPKKTLDLVGLSRHEHALYYWTTGCVPELHENFEARFRKAGAALFDGTRTATALMHLKGVVQIVDRHGIDVVQSCSDFGDIIAGIIKYWRPNLRHVVSLVNAIPASGTLRRTLLSAVYRRADHAIYVSEYVRREKQTHFPVLAQRHGVVIYNGTHRRTADGTFHGRLKRTALVTVGGINPHKNIPVLVEAMDILVNQRGRRDLYLYIVGDGPGRRDLETAIARRQLRAHVSVLVLQR